MCFKSVARPLSTLLLLTGLAGNLEAKNAPAVNRDQVKVAAVQISGYDKGDLPREGYDPAAQLVPYIDRAGNDNVQLVVFPEYVLGRISVPGPETVKIAAAAKANSVYIIVGCWEVFEDGGFANAALIFNRSGKIAGKYNKTHAAVDYYDAGSPPWSSPLKGKTRDWMIRQDPEWIMEEGNNLPVFDFDFGRVGVMTCYDGWFPESARILSLRGAELIVWINGRGGSVEDFIVKSTMFRNHVGMIATNQAYGGGTMIGDMANWPKLIVAKTPDRKEAYITATIDLKKMRATRSTSRNFAQRRPDLYGDLVAPKATSIGEGDPQVAR